MSINRFLAKRCNCIASSAIVIRRRLSVVCLWRECIVIKQLQIESRGFTGKQLRVSTVSMVSLKTKGSSRCYNFMIIHQTSSPNQRSTRWFIAVTVRLSTQRLPPTHTRYWWRSSVVKQCSTLIGVHELFTHIMTQFAVRDNYTSMQSGVTGAEDIGRISHKAYLKISTHPLLDGYLELSLIHIWRCRRIERCRSRWSPYH